MTKTIKNLILIAIVIVGVLISGAIIYVKVGKCPSEKFLSPQEATQKAINYINENLVEKGVVASLVDVVEENGLYKFGLKVGEQEFVSYVTKDGKILFPQEGIDIEKKLTPAGEETPTVQSEVPEGEMPAADKLEALAKCLSEKGVKFYGAYGCGWCNKQKELFGEAAQYLPYIECSQDRATEAEFAECREAKVGSIPDWRFPDGSQKLGLQSLEKLAELSGCQL